MRIPRKCKVCETPFVAIKSTQYYCKRACFKHDFYKRTKEKEDALKNKRPDYNCPVCTNAIPVTFDPVKYPERFDKMACPFCGIPREAIFANAWRTDFVVGNPTTAQYVIQSAIVSFTLTFTSS